MATRLNGSADGTRQAPATEEHAPRFRGTFAHADIHNLVAEKKITTTEAWLCMIIDSLVDAKGEGCWASNKYLAKRLGGMRADWVSDMITKLTQMGLVKQVGWKITKTGRCRILETAWSRIESPQPGRGGSGVITLDGSGVITPPYNTATQCSSNTRSRPAGGDGVIAETNGTNHNTTAGNGTAEHPAKRLARLLHHALSAKGKICRKANITAWAAEFRGLLEHRAAKQIESAIAQHGEHVDERMWPKLYSARSFCGEFARVEDAIKRLDDGGGGTVPRSRLKVWYDEQGRQHSKAEDCE